MSEECQHSSYFSGVCAHCLMPRENILEQQLLILETRLAAYQKLKDQIIYYRDHAKPLAKSALDCVLNDIERLESEGK